MIVATFSSPTLQVLRDYRWSSHRACVGNTKTPGCLTTSAVMKSCRRGSGGNRRRAFAEYVEEPIRDGVLESPWARLIAGAILGSEEFVNQIRRGLRGDRREQKETRPLERRHRWEEMLAVVEDVKGEKWESFRDRHGDWGRDAMIYFGRRWGRMKLAELGQRVGGMGYAAVGTALSRFARRLESPEIRSVMARIGARLS